jgi:methionine-rich copper-binding protein CopC
MVLSVLLGTVAGTLLLAAPAGAHTDFVRSDPEDGATLDDMPTRLLLEFSDEMDPRLSTVTLSLDTGASTSLDLTNGTTPSILSATVPGSLTSPAERSTWTVTFRVVSRDGHPVVGGTRFSVRGPQAEPPTSSAPADDPPGAEEDRGPAGTTEAGSDSEPGRAVWAIAALGVGALLLVVGAVGATVRLVGRDRDRSA